ncbi:unnamed protein product [Prorocentrum cordatum]|uniref:N,N-dimethylformamidase beta subunit-like C-terminal domain-containing protein n=1 Tax=Prorocentrum cordatum TaxID=2364126 RepID=A0ABN9SL07_9DINO|nr:unnamed protein product [Polarella glacialis]
MSVAPGERVDFKVRTESRRYRYDVYRLGYYAGAGARRVASFLPSAQLPQAQPDCMVEEDTLLVDCGNWAVSGSWDVPPDAVSGVYFARLTREDPPPNWRMDASEIGPNPKFANRNWDYSQMPPCGTTPQAGCTGMEHSYGAQRLAAGPKAAMEIALSEPCASHVYFVVRDDARRADILLQTMDTTWHAYNTYGAPSTYGVLPLERHNFSLPPGAQSRRSYKRSYNTPVITRDIRAVNTVFHAEFPAIRWLESNGYDVSYWSGVDAHIRRRMVVENMSIVHLRGPRRVLVWRAARRRGGRPRPGRAPLLLERQRDVLEGPVGGVADRGADAHDSACKESQESSKIDPQPDVWTGTFRDGRDINPEGAKPRRTP